jgi:hypothetical protein
LKWIGHAASGTISYNSRTAAIAVPVLSGLVLLGAAVSVILFILAKYGKVRWFWQTVMLILGMVFLLLIQGH